MEVPSPPRRAPQAKPMVSRQILPHSDTSSSLISPATQLLAGHIQNPSNNPPEQRVPAVPTIPVVPTSVPQRETSGSLLAHRYPPQQLVSSPPALTAPVESIVAPYPPICRVLQPLRELEPWIHGHGVGIRGLAAQLHPSDSIRRRVILLGRV